MEAACYRDDGSALLAFPTRCEGDGWSTAVDITLLRWDDLVRQAFRGILWSRLATYARLAGHLAGCGLFRRAWRADYRFGSFFLYPFIATPAIILSIAALSAAIGLLAGRYGVWPGWSAGLLALAGGLYGFLRLERALYLRYLLEDWLFTFAFLRGELPAMDARLDRFAEAVLKAAQDPAFDEVLVVGHSTGSCLAVEVVARALRRAPAQPVTAPALLTIGSIVSFLSLYPGATKLRQAVAELARTKALCWIETRAAMDVISLPDVDPLAAAGLSSLRLERAWPHLLPVNLTLLLPAHRPYRLRERFRFFATHFLYFSTMPPKGRLDLFSIFAGPIRLADRYRSSIEAAGRDPAPSPPAGSSPDAAPA